MTRDIMASKVFYASMKCRNTESPLNKIKKLINKCCPENSYNKKDLVAIKLHFGELGNTAFIRPIYLRPVIETMRRLGANPFLTDTNTLYAGMRTNSCDHITNAQLNGFGYSTLQTPIIIADGLRGENTVTVPIPNGTSCKNAKLAADIINADGLFTVSHFKGHEMTGFGGALKNLAMGCASRSGKLDMHSNLRPEVNSHKCTACGRCKVNCQAGAITISKTAAINDNCTGCARCIAVCPEKAINVNYNVACGELQKRIAEYASAVHGAFKNPPIYLNLLTSIVPACDCCGGNDAPMVQDLGFMTSLDPVAIDKASYDLVVQTAGKDVFKEKWTYLDPLEQFHHAEKLQFGSTDYELIKIS